MPGRGRKNVQDDEPAVNVLDDDDVSVQVGAKRVRGALTKPVGKDAEVEVSADVGLQPGAEKRVGVRLRKRF